MTETKLKIQAYGSQFNGPEGIMLNGKLSVTVASNNLTVALKTLAGNDPSAADPVAVRMGGVVRLITAALSITRNAGTNWAVAGSAEFATKEIDWFVYLHWYPDSSTMYLMFSRIGYIRNFVDFPNFNSTTDGKTALHSGAVANATDSVVVIGRFAATLSAGAGYTWTVPTYTDTNLVQGPIFETRLLSWVPTMGDASLGNGTLTGSYKLVGKSVKFLIKFTFGSSSSISGNLNFARPFVPLAETTELARALAWDDSATIRYISTATLVASAIYPNTGTTGYGYIRSTHPMTWATSDYLLIDMDYLLIA